MFLKSKRVWLEERFQPMQIRVEGGKITGLLPYDQPADALDYGDLRILPGLIDIHNHGYLGGDSNHATADWLRKWVSYLPSEGVTSLLATTSSAPEDTMLRGMAAIADAIEQHPRGAEILGVYSEGPLISVEFRGAQDEACIVKPTPEKITQYQNACRGRLVYCCIAPEMDEELAATRFCVGQGIRVSLGHTGATFDQCAAARAAGAVSFAHTYNAMRGLHHREPGTLGAAMYFKDMYAELIGDGVHVDFRAANLLARLKGKDRLILVTDSVQIKGLPPGEYHAQDRHVFLGEDGVGRLPNGSIAGSAARMNRLLGNLIDKAGVPEVTAINAATCNPVEMLGLADRKGYIRSGWDADLVVLEDDYAVRQTYCLGEAMLGG